MHEPVLLKEVLQALDPKPGAFIIDGTVDGGGHAAAILEKIMPRGMFLGIDWDKRMIAAREQKKKYGDRERYAHANYADLPTILTEQKLGKADGLLLDLGFSSEHLARSGRGFSFGEGAAGEPLLMTYDDARPSVAELLRGAKEDELADIIFRFGGERLSRRIAKAIVMRERERPIVTSGELAATVRGAVPERYERGRIDPATRTFQALRIWANDELGNLSRALKDLPRVLRRGGRVAVISFHSLEDRIIKRSFQKLAKENVMNITTKKPIVPSREEIARNPRSRSAKLRAGIMR
jgi:16S rRNA (cytosine1402-N4)-methyltransferase